MAMKRVVTLQEAQSHFFRDPNESVICMKHEKEQVCRTYPEAIAFYTRKEGRDVLSDRK